MHNRFELLEPCRQRFGQPSARLPLQLQKSVGKWQLLDLPQLRQCDNSWGLRKLRNWLHWLS
jgi:hypothetical protein